MDSDWLALSVLSDLVAFNTIMPDKSIRQHPSLVMRMWIFHHFTI